MKGLTRALSCVAVLLGAALGALAAPPEVPAKVSAKPGQLVRIVVKADAGKLGLTRTFTDEEAFWGELIAPAGERHFVFQAPPVGKTKEYVLAWWTAGELVGTTTTITVEPLKPPVPPDPVVPPTPLPDGAFGLTKVSRDGLAKVQTPNKAAVAKGLADANRTMASTVAAGGYPDPSATQANAVAVLDSWGLANVAAVTKGGDTEVQWDPWAAPVGKQFFGAYSAKKLKTKADWVACFNEIAAGLDP